MVVGRECTFNLPAVSQIQYAYLEINKWISSTILFQLVHYLISSNERLAKRSIGKSAQSGWAPALTPILPASRNPDSFACERGFASRMVFRRSAPIQRWGHARLHQNWTTNNMLPSLWIVNLEIFFLNYFWILFGRLVEFFTQINCWIIPHR